MANNHKDKWFNVMGAIADSVDTATEEEIDEELRTMGEEPSEVVSNMRATMLKTIKTFKGGTKLTVTNQWNESINVISKRRDEDGYYEVNAQQYNKIQKLTRGFEYEIFTSGGERANISVTD